MTWRGLRRCVFVVGDAGEGNGGFPDGSLRVTPARRSSRRTGNVKGSNLEEKKLRAGGRGGGKKYAGDSGGRGGKRNRGMEGKGV